MRLTWIASLAVLPLQRFHFAECGKVAETPQLQCPHCRAKMRVRDPSILGKKVRCPKCKNPFGTKSPDDPTDDDSFLSGLDGLEDEYGPVSQPAPPAARPRPRSTPPDDDVQRDESPPERRKKKRRARETADGLPPILWPLCGLIGGAIGGAVWVVIAFALHRQFGIIAWGVGALTGLGVAMAAGRRAGTATGALAAGLALCVILASKLIVAILFVNQWAAQLEAPAHREEQIVFQEALAIAEEQQDKGIKLNWPPGKSLDAATELADFPEPIAKQAQKNWDEQTPRMKEIKKNMDQIAQAGKAFVIGVAFVGSFSLFDLLWFFLAMASAFRLGRGIID
jgi:predicted Zn finger-like uncharacterized protein